MTLELLRKAKSPADLAELLRTIPREELAHLVFSLAKLEPHYSAEQIAQMEGMTAQTIRRDIKAGLFGGEYFARNPRQLRVSASGVKAWRDTFRIKVPASR